MFYSSLGPGGIMFASVQEAQGAPPPVQINHRVCPLVVEWWVLVEGGGASTRVRRDAENSSQDSI